MHHTIHLFRKLFAHCLRVCLTFYISLVLICSLKSNIILTLTFLSKMTSQYIWVSKVRRIRNGKLKWSWLKFHMKKKIMCYICRYVMKTTIHVKIYIIPMYTLNKYKHITFIWVSDWYGVWYIFCHVLFSFM